MSVYLRGADVAMAQHRLNAANVGTIHQKVGCEAMAHGVWTYLLRDAREPGVFIDSSLDAACRKATIIAGH